MFPRTVPLSTRGGKTYRGTEIIVISAHTASTSPLPSISFISELSTIQWTWQGHRLPNQVCLQRRATGRTRYGYSASCATRRARCTMSSSTTSPCCSRVRWKRGALPASYGDSIHELIFPSRIAAYSYTQANNAVVVATDSSAWHHLLCIINIKD